MTLLQPPNRSPNAAGITMNHRVMLTMMQSGAPNAAVRGSFNKSIRPPQTAPANVAPAVLKSMAPISLTAPVTNDLAYEPQTPSTGIVTPVTTRLGFGRA